MSYKVVSPFTSLPSEPIYETGKYPYLVIRLMASVYQRHLISVYQGKESVEISHHRNYVRYPVPITDDGAITPDCRTYLLDAVLQAVKDTGFRMAVVWGEKEVSYVEKDGSIEKSTEPPTGGVPLPNKIAFDKQIRTDPVKNSFTEEGISKTGFVLNIKKTKPNSISGPFNARMVDPNNLYAKVKFQSETDATLHYLNSASLNDAIDKTIERMRYLFGENISDELVKRTVSKTYAEHEALNTKKWDKKENR